MRTKLILFGLLSCFALCLPVSAQTPLDPPVTPETPEVDALPAKYSVFADDDVSTHAARTLDEVRAAIERSDDLRPLQKFRLLRRLNRPWVAERVTDEITLRAMSAGLVRVDMDGNDDVQVMVDWDGLIEFIERLIPLIVQLIGLFG